MSTTISTKAAPAAIGPYSQAVQAGSLVFLSGQIGLDPQTGQMVEGGFEAQGCTARCRTCGRSSRRLAVPSATNACA